LVPEYKTLPLFGPKWISAKFPENIDERNEFLFSVLDGGDDLGKTPKYYIPYADSQTDIINKLQPLVNLKDFNTNKLETYNNLMDKYPSKVSNVGYLPLKGFVVDLTVILDKSTAEVLEISELRPWGDI